MKKMDYKRYNINQNYFYTLQELHYMDKSKVTSSLPGIWWLLFSLHYDCQFVKGQLKQKSGGLQIYGPEYTFYICHYIC